MTAVISRIDEDLVFDLELGGDSQPEEDEYSFPPASLPGYHSYMSKGQFTSFNSYAPLNQQRSANKLYSQSVGPSLGSHMRHARAPSPLEPLDQPEVFPGEEGEEDPLNSSSEMPPSQFHVDDDEDEEADNEREEGEEEEDKVKEVKVTTKRRHQSVGSRPRSISQSMPPSNPLLIRNDRRGQESDDEPVPHEEIGERIRSLSQSVHWDDRMIFGERPSNTVSIVECVREHINRISP